MRQFYDFSEPMPKSERQRKIEYADEQDKFATTSKYVKLPSSIDVIAKSNREPRGKSPSPLLVAHMDGKKVSEDHAHQFGFVKPMSEASKKAREEIFKKLGKTL